MKRKPSKYAHLSVVYPSYRRPYPNAAEPGYFLNKALDYITVAVSCFGMVTTLFFLASR